LYISRGSRALFDLDLITGAPIFCEMAFAQDFMFHIMECISKKIYYLYSIDMAQVKNH